MNQDSDSHIRQNTPQSTIILALSLPLTFLTIVISCVGLFTPGFYLEETSNCQTQPSGQDTVNLFVVVPCLIITSILAYKKNQVATIVLDGILLYLTYTFVLYSFDVHFNRLFLIYCVCLGFSFYSLMHFLLIQFKETNKTTSEDKSAFRFIRIYFIIISVLFYFLWLSEIILAIIRNAKPKSLVETAVCTNGLQVLDISVVLPGIFMTGIFLLNRTQLGFILTPIILTFLVLLNIVITALSIIIKIKGIESNWAIIAIISVVALASFAMLIWYLKSIKTIITN